MGRELGCGLFSGKLCEGCGQCEVECDKLIGCGACLVEISALEGCGRLWLLVKS